MSTGRDWRDKSEHSGEQDEADALPWPGKRTGVGSANRTAAPEWPGKRSRTSGLAIARSTTATGKPLQVPQPVVDTLSTARGASLENPQDWSARVGADVSDARVVTAEGAPEAARSIDARAFTVGNRVFFSEGRGPTTDGGDLLAHELTHVAQQRGGAAPTSWSEIPFVDGADHRETEARAHDGGSASASGHAIARDGETKSDAQPSSQAVPARGDYVVFLLDDGSYELDFNTFDVRGWSDPVFFAFRYYMWQVFPGATEDMMRELVKELKIDFTNNTPVPPGADQTYGIHVLPGLQTNVIAWMAKHHPELHMQQAKAGGSGLRHADQGGGGGGKAKPAPSKIDSNKKQDDATGSASTNATIGISHDLYERLRKAFPDEPIVQGKGFSTDLLEYLADHADEVSKLKKEKSEHTLDLEELQKLLEALKKQIDAKKGSTDGDVDGHDDGKEGGGKEGGKDGDTRETRKGGDSDGSIYGEEGGSKYGWIRFDPKGAIRLQPDLKSYVTGSSVHLEMHWDTSVHPHAADVLLANHCDYSWTIRHNGEIVDTAGNNHGFLDDRDKSYDVGDDPGTYEIEVVATSRHFKQKSYTAKATITAITEKAADKNTFDAAHVAGPDATFTRDDNGKLHVRDGQVALTAADEIKTLDITTGGVDKLAEQGKISPSDQKTLDEQFKKQREALLEIQKKTKKGTPYIVRGSFVSREDSSTMPLRVFMSMLDHSVTDGEAEYKLILHDTSFGEAVQHPGSSSHSLEGERLGTVYRMIEKEALDDMFEHFHNHNDYPKGTLHLAAQQLMGSGDVWEKTRDTNNWRKKAKKVAHGVAMVGGIALMVVPGGGVIAVGLMVVTTAAGVTGIALEIEDRMAKEGGLKFDRRLVMDVLQVVAMALPFGAMTKTLAEASAVAKTRYLLCMTGIDAAQGFMIAQDVRTSLARVDANTAVALANAKDDDERKQILDQRDQQVAEIIGGAVVSGGFVLISLGGGIKQVVATSRAGGSFKVREPVVEIAKQGRPKMEEALATDSFPHENERVQLTDEEKSYLEHEVATPEAKTDEASKPAHERTTQQTPAVDPNAKGSDEGKPAHERPTQKMPAVDPNAKAPGADQVTHVVFNGKGDTISAAAAKVTPEGGYFDVVVHGDPKQFWVLHDGAWVPVKANSVRRWLAGQKGYSGQPIRLLSCESGALTNGLAQSMANGMGVKVKAPTETLWIHGDGSLTVGPDPANPTGSWNEFSPYKAADKPVVEPAAPKAPDPTPTIGPEVTPKETPQETPKETPKETGDPARDGPEPKSLGKKKNKGKATTPETTPTPEPRRATALVDRANALPEATPNRAELIEEAKALDAEEAAATKDKPTGAEFETKLAALHDKLAVAELPVATKKLVTEAETLEQRANKLPHESKKRWDLIAKAGELKGQAKDTVDLADSGMRDSHLTKEVERIRQEEEALDREVTEAEAAAQGEKPKEPTLLEKRIKKATWDSHGGKHTKGRTNAEAKKFSEPTDSDPSPPSQYMKEVDVSSLEREALENGTPYEGDPEVEGSTVYLWYDAKRDIGYDHGEAVQTMRVEITAGDVFHGHPRSAP